MEVEEQKRGKRLFGALLGTLNQRSPSVSQQRRQEIERRQLAKLKSQQDELDQKQKDRLDDLNKIRHREMRTFQEDTVSNAKSSLAVTNQC